MKQTLPIELPACWTAETDETLGVIITAVDLDGHKGFVTVSESLRSYALGFGPVTIPKKLYSGRYWRKELFEEAVAVLQAAMS
ncbi:TPA: hypothetical protein ACP32N_005008 [Pseudomonas aeruginosa]